MLIEMTMKRLTAKGGKLKESKMGPTQDEVSSCISNHFSSSFFHHSSFIDKITRMYA